MRTRPLCAKARPRCREVAAGRREETSTLREDTATLREDAASVREEAAQEDLRDSRVLLAQTGRLAKVGGWQLDVDTQTLIWTEEVYRIHEVDPATKPTVAEAIQFYAPEARPVITAAVQAAIDAGTSFDLELPLLTARGRYIWVRALGIAERRDGKTIRVYGAFQDITDRKRAEEALRDSEARLHAIVRAIPDLMFRLNGNGMFLDYWAQLDDDLYVSPDAIVGRSVPDTLPPDLADRVLHAIRTVLESGELQRLEYRCPIRPACATTKPA